MIRAIIHLVVSFLAIFVIFSLMGLAALALALGFGWLLQYVLPFTWFETTLLSMLAIIPIFLALLNKLMGVPLDEQDAMDEEEYEWEDEAWEDEEEEEEEEDEEEEPAIPVSRFWKKPSSPTWNAMLQFALANEIYETLSSGPPAQRWGEEELQEVAVDVAISAVDILKRIPPRKNLHISKSKLRTALQKQTRWPEYEPFFEDFYHIVNLTVTLWHDVIREVQSNRLWNQPATDL